MIDIQAWANDNSGYLALVLFFAALLVSFTTWLVKRFIKKKAAHNKLRIELLEAASMCTSFDTGNVKDNFRLHRTVFMLYLKLVNEGDKAVSIGNIEVGYRSQKLPVDSEWRWLKDETVMLEDYKVPFGDNVKIYPFLKQRGVLDNIEPPDLHIESGDSRNGIVYFEQEESTLNDLPYMGPDCKVTIKVMVFDNIGNSWNSEFRVPKVKIEAIRKVVPSFGMTRELSGAGTY